MAGQRELYFGAGTLACPAVVANPGALSFCRLIVQAAPRPLGALTVVYENAVLQFGTPDEESARILGAVHRQEDEGLATVPPAHPEARSAESLGFDLSHPDLGLPMERDRRFPMPAIRDRKAGEWVHPVVHVKSGAFFVRALTQRNLGVGEAFLADEFEMLRGSVHHFILFFLVNAIDRKIELPAAENAKLLWQYARWRATRSHNEDIADHYDIGDNIMVPMLGATGCYTCGYMQREDDELDRMQINKMNLIFSKLRLKPGMRILDTGCGNGGMLVHAALSWGCEGEGFTNSFNMTSLARRNAASNGVADKVKIHHADFSLLASYPDNHFDAIYEVGVWEHLPFAEYHEVMQQCHRILKPHGRMLIHSMGSHTAKHVRDGYIQKYIFRDSNQIRLHLLLDEARQLDMYPADIENIGHHYYWTLWYWRRNLLAAYEKDPTIRDRDFRVMLYFLECGMGESRAGDGSVYHILLYRDARDYRQTFRVDGRIGEYGRGALEDRPFIMKPCTENEHLNNDINAPGKLDQPVYRPPSVWKRVRHLWHTVRSVKHQ